MFQKIKKQICLLTTFFLVCTCISFVNVNAASDKIMEVGDVEWITFSNTHRFPNDEEPWREDNVVCYDFQFTVSASGEMTSDIVRILEENRSPHGSNESPAIKIEAVKPGVAKIGAYARRFDNGEYVYLPDLYEVEVRIYPNAVSLNTTELQLKAGESQTLTATLLPENTTIENRDFIWQSENPDVATVSGTGSTGIVTAVGIGTTTISAVSQFDHDLVATCTVTVTTPQFTYESYGSYISIRGIKLPADFNGPVEIPAQINKMPVKRVSLMDAYPQITELILPDGIEELSLRDLSAWTGLKKINIPEGITYLDNYMFRNCTNLETVELPDSLTEIGTQAFLNSGIKNITIPENVEKINYQAFAQCKNLTEVILPESLIELVEQAFWDSGITKINIPSGIETLPNRTFALCENLSDVTLSEGLERIEGEAFWFCENLKNIQLPSSLTDIAAGAFQGAGLESITIPKHANMEGQPFADCLSLKEIIVDEQNPYFSNDEHGVLYNKEKTKLCVYPQGKPEQSYTVPNGVTDIARDAFGFNYELSTLESISIPKSLKNIGSRAFEQCTNLNTIYYAGSETDFANITIESGNEAFKNATVIFGEEEQADITVDPSAATLNVGDTKVLTAQITGDTASQTVLWQSDTPAVATVQDGLVTAVAPGTATITATHEESGKTAQCHITVTEEIPEVDIIVNPSAATLNVGDKKTLTAQVTGNTASQTVLWQSDTPAVATVQDGVVTAVAPGAATITATHEESGKTAQCRITVTEEIPEGVPTVAVQSVSVQPGDELTVAVDIKNCEGFANLGLEIDYDSDIFILISAENNPEVGAVFVPSQDESVKPYILTWNSVSNTQFSGTLVTLTFKVADNAMDGEYPISVSYYKGANGDYEDGNSVNYDENFESLGLHYQSGIVSVREHIPGDINGDGFVDNKDGTFLLRKLAGWDVSVDTSALDINGDGFVDNKDGTILLRKLAGWDVEIH